MSDRITREALQRSSATLNDLVGYVEQELADLEARLTGVPLREQFAMAAMTGMLAANPGLQLAEVDEYPAEIARGAYVIADRMLAEREKGKP